MRVPFVAAAVVAFALIACGGPATSTPGTDPEDRLTETPKYVEASPSGVAPAPDSPQDTATEAAKPAEPTPSVLPPSPESSENTLIETAEYTGVIISADGVSAFGYLFDQASTEFWEPSMDDISAAEACIGQFLAAVAQDSNAYQSEDAAFILENLGEYRRQYVGIVVEGEKRVWCNAFFSKDSFPDWQRIPVDVDGGGNHFWQIEYDPLRDECISFHVHRQS